MNEVSVEQIDQVARATYSMIVAQKLVKEVDGLITDKPLVIGIDKRVPRLAGEARENLVILRVQLNIVLVQVLEELLCSEHLCNLHKLVGVAVTVEERFLSEYHGGEHSTQRPHVQGVIVLLEVNKQLRPFEIPRCDANIVLGTLVVEFGQTPVNQPQLETSQTSRSRNPGE